MPGHMLFFPQSLHIVRRNGLGDIRILDQILNICQYPAPVSIVQELKYVVHADITKRLFFFPSKDEKRAQEHKVNRPEFDSGF